jgi:hypothetical protein
VTRASPNDGHAPSHTDVSDHSPPRVGQHRVQQARPGGATVDEEVAING